MSKYDYILTASADLHAGRITQADYDRIISRYEQFVVVNPSGYIVAICGSALHDEANQRAVAIAGNVHHVCSYGRQFNLGGHILPYI